MNVTVPPKEDRPPPEAPVCHVYFSMLEINFVRNQKNNFVFYLLQLDSCKPVCQGTMIIMAKKG